MVIPCLISDNRSRTSSNSRKILQLGEYVDSLCSDYEHLPSSSTRSSGTGSNNDIVSVDSRFDIDPVEQKKIEFSQMISEHQRKCYTHLDNIDSMINRHFNNKMDQEFVNQKYFLLKQEMRVQKKISETREEIQKLRISIDSERIVLVNNGLKIVSILIGLLICALFSTLLP